ncbi:MAG: hypothetical protein JNL57_07320 [Bacteroidetes bacterium]|nr:hypothetical protein [Bacteroidota bacterium]
MRRLCILTSLLIPASSVIAQLSNRSFLLQPSAPTTRWGMSLDVLHFIKNNEYFSNLNPGATFIGVQGQGLIHYRLNEQNTLRTGIFLQQNYGESKPIARPVFQLDLKKKKWNFLFGNVLPHVNHGLPEPVYNYENVFTHPLETGLQIKHRSSRIDYDLWLDWRQRANAEKGRQEQLFFGQSAEISLIKTHTLKFSVPAFATIFHRGGQALQTNYIPMATRILAGGGGRFYLADSALILEGLCFQSLDNSPTPSQPFTNGWAGMGNIRLRLHHWHEVALSMWYAREFTSTFGAPMFSNVNLQDVYLNRNTRYLAMLRYVVSRPLVERKLWIDFRVEPYYDFQYKKTEFSMGLYFRYLGSNNLRIPGRLF